MKEKNFKEIARKLIVCLTVLLMISAYLPAINTIVKATVPDENQITKTTNQTGANNQVPLAEAETKKTETDLEQSKTETKEEETPLAQPQAETTKPETTETNSVQPKTETTIAQPQAETNTTIEIKDAKLKEYLLNNYDKNGDKAITESEMLEITSLSIYDSNIKDLTGLEYAKNIEELYLTSNQYENMNSVYGLLNLKKLTLEGNNIKNLVNFKNANKLEELRLYNYNSSNNDVINYSYIASITSLKTLEITDTSLTTAFNINTLSKLTNLEKLNLNLNNQIKDITNIGSFANLTELDLSANYIEDISPLKNLTKLETLRIKTTDSDKNMETLKAINVKQSLYYYQDIDNIYIEKGKKTEAELPTVIQKMTDKNSPIYTEEINVDSSLISLNNDKTKLILDGTKAELGTGTSYIRANHDYNNEGQGGRTVQLNIKYTVHETVEKKEEVNIPDSELKRYLLKEYDADGDKVITNYDMLQIKTLYIAGNYDIKNLTGLEVAQNITSLSLSANYTDVSAVNKLKNLKTLSISNYATDIIPKLTIVNNLTSLTINNYNGKELDYAQLGTLKNLQELTVYESGRKTNIDMNTLKNLTNLKTLRITTTVKLDNLDALQQLKALTTLGLHTGDKLEDIAFVSKLTWLTNLDLSDNMISNITPLRALTKLTYLNIERNPINTKESETAETLKTLKDKGTNISVIETNATTNIEFKDAKFKEVLLKNNTADLNKDNQISIEEMERLSYLYLSASNNETISSIDEITYATNLYHISIYSKVEDLTPITKLKNLKNLSISGDSLNDKNLKIIAGLTNLETLSVSVNNNINNLEVFGNLKNLKDLSVSCYVYVEGKQKVFDLKGIEKLTNLNRVSVLGSVSNINLLKKLPKLQRIETSEKLYKEDGTQLTNKELVDFLKSLNVKNIRFSGSQSEVKLGNILVGSNQKLNLATIDNELIKLAFTPGSMFYDEYTKVSFYENNENKIEHPITLNTNEMGEKYLSVSISNDKFSCSVSLRWNNYIKGDTTKEINIPDANLKKILLENNDMDNDKKITEQDMINMQWMDGYNAEISSLEGLQYAKNLKYIGLSGNYIKDLSPILGITTLESVDLSNNLLTDISGLGSTKWTALNYINLNNNFINFKNSTNYNTLKNIMKSIQNEYYDWENELTQTINSQYENIGEIDNEVILEDALKARLIRLGIDTNKDGKITRREMYYANMLNGQEDMFELNLSNANITNISGLEYLGFSYIDLSDNNIEDITPITKNKKVIFINLSNNNISNISGIENNYNLIDINLSNNKITNITPLTNLFSMKKKANWREVYINLANNEISNIDCVKNWKNLATLDLSGNKITNIKELNNYNFKLWDNMDEDTIKEMASYLTIDLSENNIDMTKAENKKAKELFDNMGATLKLVDKTKTTEYVLDNNGRYSKDSNLGIISTELSNEGQYEFVPEIDRTYYPNGSDEKLAGIFVNTKYYDGDSKHSEEIKAKGYDVEILVTGAIKTENELDGTEYLIFTLKLPNEYVGGEALMQTENCSIIKTTRNTLELKLILNPDEKDNKYASINASILLKAKELTIKAADSNDEIIKAIKNGQNVTIDMVENVKDVEAEIFRNLANKDNVDLKVQTSNAIWKFNSNDITDPNINVNPTVTIANNKFENMDKTPFEDAIYLKFDHEGPLPGKAEIELDISQYNIYEKGKTVYLYYYDSTKKEYQYLNALIVGDKRVTITLDHCSEYVISDKLLVANIDDENNGGNGEGTPEQGTVIDDNANNVNKPSNPNKPNTGDNRHISFWISLMFVSIVGIVYIVLQNRKEKHNK